MIHPALAIRDAAAPARPGASAHPWAERPGLAMAAGLLLAGLLTLPKAVAVWRTGIFFDPDDAMRAVQLRDWLAGQPFYDLVPHRLSPDHPFTMHWSRLDDLVLAALEKLFALAWPAPEAERLMRLAAPALLFAAALAAILAMARRLGGPRAGLPAALLFAGAPEALGCFIPGHIHHHGIQVALLLGAAAALLRGLDASEAAANSSVRRGRALRAGALAGALSAVSLGIGLQNLPFVMGLVAVAGLAWVGRGAAAAPFLAALAGALAVGTAGAFLADVPPARWGEGACDALSMAHLLPVAVGGLLLLGLAAASHRMPRVLHRAIAAGVAAPLAILPVAWCFPACLHDPMAGVDPLLVSRWLADVGEALPLAALAGRDPAGGWALALALAAGLALTVIGLQAAPRPRRAPWMALLILAAIGILGTLYQIRVAGSALALLVPGTAAGALRLHDRLARHPNRPALLAAVLLALAGNSAAWAALTVPAARLLGESRPGAVTATTAAADPSACFEPAIWRPLAGLRPGLVLSTIDPGSTILAETPHSVLAAPYHRDAAGIRVALLAFSATPEEARPIVEAARPSYLALCRASPEAQDEAAREPGRLAAALLAGKVPPWLEPLGTGREPVLLFRVR